jgi:hypothetical protein
MVHQATVATRRRKTPLGAGAPRQIRTGAAGQPTLLVKNTSTYDWIWNDDESGADADVAIWRPNPSDTSFFIVGDYAQGDYGSPIGTSLIVKAINDDPSNPLITKPKKYVKVWKDKDSGGKYDGSIWAPVPEDGYYALGFVGQMGYDEPSISNFACVRSDLCEAADVGALIWSDLGSDAKDDVSLYAAVGVSGAFVAQANFDPYSGTAYKLKSSS